ncbi:MAG: [protein-PII] uridylyltransferase [Gammaproteobacteria bacterium]
MGLTRALHAKLLAEDHALRAGFAAGIPIAELLHTRAEYVDRLVRRAWRAEFAALESQVALAAVGGYGRRELHPGSDIDLLILFLPGKHPALANAVAGFIACLWDAGLRASHSVRSVAECQAAARNDLATATNLMEARYLSGHRELFTELQAVLSPAQLWPARAFLDAKRREQAVRHAKYHDTPGQLEPNLKEGPGGLRDLQTVQWTAQRHFGTSSFSGLRDAGFLNEAESQTLQTGQAFLWRVRFALHLLYGRHEDRLLFDAQPQLARQFGYRDGPALRAVENFMQDYYRTIKELGLLNEILLQALDEILQPADASGAEPLSEHFEIRAGLLRQTEPYRFSRYPGAILELFRIWQQQAGLKGVDAATLRALRANLARIDDEFRADPANHAVFMQILRARAGVTHALRRMSRHGVLAAYLPAFGAIVGRMQYDLFHAYTVDEHILAVVSNLRRFALSRYDHEFPFCSEIMQALPKPELAYLAGLFHDIAKGRGGDHSELGALAAEEFCLEHGLGTYDARLVAWLVRHHLLLSRTAQKQDIHDPQVVNAFVRQVGDPLHLDFLYVLTVADVRGTNPDLWTSWKAGLFAELYRATSRRLRQGLEEPIEKDEFVREIQAQALATLRSNGLLEARVRELWGTFTDEYFLHHTPDEVVWHTECLAQPAGDGASGVYVRQQSLRGGTAIAILAAEDGTLFERITAALAELGLTVLDARLTPLKAGGRLDTYMVLEDNRAPIDNPERLREIELWLQRETTRRNAAPRPISRRAPRQVRLFTTPVEVQFREDPLARYTLMEIGAGDRPGLLSLIGQVLRRHKIRLQNAKITTVGERAEDVFFITDTANRPLADEARRARLRTDLQQKLGAID